MYEVQGVRRRDGDLATGVAYQVYLEEAGTNLADISASSGGSSIAGSTVTVADIAGLGPAALRWWGPTTDTDELYLRCPSDPTLPVQRVEAVTDPRLDALEAAGSIASHQADTTAIHGIADTAQLARRDEANTFTDDQAFGSGRPWHDVRAYGAVGDGRFATGAIAASTATLTATTSVFAPSDVGKYINVYGAGVAGAHLAATITGYTSPTVVTLSPGASTTVTGATFIWGTDDTTAFQSWLTALQAGTTRHGHIPAGPGAYLVRTTLAITGRHLRITGDRHGRVTEGGGTTIYWCNTGELFKLGADNAQAYDDADYDGPQGLTLENLNLAGIGLARTSFSHALGSYATGTYAIRDWKGGDLQLRDVFIEQFQYGIWTVQSDLSTWLNVNVFYAQTGVYLGPRSDQISWRGGTLFSCDTAIKADATVDLHVEDVAFVVCGSATTAAVEVTASTWGRPADAVTFDHCWFEYEGGYSSVLAMVQVGTTPVTGTTVGTVVLRNCSVPNIDPAKVVSFAQVGKVTTVVIEDLTGTVLNLFTQLVNFVGSASPKVLVRGPHHDNHTFTNSGSGSPIMAYDASANRATAAPSTGTWRRGEIVWNSTPSAAGTPGWVCTTAGTPGTWKAMGNVAA